MMVSYDELQERQARRRALGQLALVCVVALVLVLLATTGVSDVFIAGGAR